METNLNSFRKMMQTFLEASGRGYWEISEENLEKLRQLYSDVEDKIEGIDRCIVDTKGINSMADGAVKGSDSVQIYARLEYESM
ncbi:uncharacterized protein A4U43_C03F18280 [Asparagus officinalis]|uniref:Uncharacterized protein n=1 Tax=Asparagus officinalis TaxID=4686 RepID=A0A5P1FG85_ASPOF|nr:uncharacterized protein A4U43_C03F18280 [Asparagus officinalis]